MQTIYIEVTNLTKSQSLTGIQRVERNVAQELYKILGERLCFISFCNEKSEFEILDLKEFIAFAAGGGYKSEVLHSGKYISPKQMKPGDIFFEIDAVWNESYKSSVLLPELKQRGVRIAGYIYDIIPIEYPQFSHYSTRFGFMNYIGAYLQYSDILITSSQSVLDSVYGLADKLNLPHIPGYVSWLGSDFDSDDSDSEIHEKVKEIADKKYILSVGTIEPRKNHEFLINAFEQGLFDEDLYLVFAGKIGWNVENLMKRISEHPEKDVHLFHFEGLNDASIDYLYSNALAVAVPTYAEGFGLPVVESLQRGTPVIASDIPILRETGGDYCRFFKPDDIEAFQNIVFDLLKNEDERSRLKEHIASFVSVTWKETAQRIADALLSLKPEERKPLKNVRQMVILTARTENIERSIPYIEEYMPFIDKLLLCCPDNVAGKMSSIATKRVSIEVLSDGELLQGRELPRDHGTRNFFLRCLAMRSEKLDDVFIMSDDDYRPLKNIKEDFFVNDNSYKAYYCYDLNDWKGNVGRMTSYDYYIFRTRDFVNKNRYPSLQYSSHMPQIIEKALYLEMLDEHKGIEKNGLDEWSSYFNYVQAKYPDLIKSEPYATVCWPGLMTDWKMEVQPSEFCFENFYEMSYEKDGIFSGLSMTFDCNAAEDNEIKIRRYKDLTEDYFKKETVCEKYLEEVIKDKLEVPSFVIDCDSDNKSESNEIVIGGPEYIKAAKDSVIHIPFTVIGEREGLSLQLEIFSAKNIVQRMPVIRLDKDDLKLVGSRFFAPLICGKPETPGGDYSLSVIIDDSQNRYEKKFLLKLK